jgi:hypothetical protein
MKLVNNLKVHTITAEELGMTEDEFSNFLIDFWQHNEKYEEHLKEKGIISAVAGLPVTITITKDNHGT